MQYDILLYDQFPLIRNTLSVLIKKNFKNCNVVIACSVDDLFILSSKKSFHLIFLDIVSENLKDFQLFRIIRLTNKNCKIIIFSDTSLAIYNQKINRVTLLDKSSPEKKIVQFIRLVLFSEICFPNELFLDGKKNKNNDFFLNDISKLSNLEIECVVLLVRGYTIHEISEKMSINIENVNMFINKLLAKTEVKNLIELSSFYEEI